MAMPILLPEVAIRVGRFLPSRGTNVLLVLFSRLPEQLPEVLKPMQARAPHHAATYPLVCATRHGT